MPYCERGSATCYALLIMTILLIITAGLLPSANSMLKMTKIDQDSEIAQAAAEAGARRAIAELYQETDANIDLCLSDEKVTTKALPSYSVSISHKRNSIYTITSTGSYRDTHRTVQVDVTLPSQTDSGTYIDLYKRNVFAFSPGPIQIGAWFWGGPAAIFSKSSIELNLLCKLSAASQLTSGKYYLLTPGKENISVDFLKWIDFPSRDAKESPYEISTAADIYDLPQDFDKNCDDLTELWKSSKAPASIVYDKNTNTFKIIQDHKMEPARYVIDGNLALENRGLDLARSLTVTRPGCLTLHIKGNLEVCKSARLGFFLENTLPNALDNFLDREYQNMKYMFFIVDGDVTIKEQSGANNIVIVSKGTITIENNVNFSGCMQAKKGIFISPSGFGAPVNLRYKEECVKPNRDLIAYINSPPETSDPALFKVGQWKNRNDFQH